jgi:hypothetical protein
MRENLALRSLRIRHIYGFEDFPYDSHSVEEVIQLCKNKKRGFTFKSEISIAAEDFMRVIKTCPHIVFLPKEIYLDCNERDVEETIISMMNRESDETILSNMRGEYKHERWMALSLYDYR